MKNKSFCGDIILSSANFQKTLHREWYEKIYFEQNSTVEFIIIVIEAQKIN